MEISLRLMEKNLQTFGEELFLDLIIYFYSSTMFSYILLIKGSLRDPIKKLFLRIKRKLYLPGNAQVK